MPGGLNWILCGSASSTLSDRAIVVSSSCVRGCPIIFLFLSLSLFLFLFLFLTPGMVLSSGQAVEQLNIKAKNFRDLLTDEPFSRQDIITLQVSVPSHCCFWGDHPENLGMVLTTLPLHPGSVASSLPPAWLRFPSCCWQCPTSCPPCARSRGLSDEPLPHSVSHTCPFSACAYFVRAPHLCFWHHLDVQVAPL